MRTMRRWATLLAVAIPVHGIKGQTVDGARAVRSPAVAGSVSGVVHDSVAQAPLAGALVQLVAADSLSSFGSTVVSDSLGQYTFAAVPTGRYTLGFYHPMLDSLGLEPTLHAVTVTNDHTVRVILAIPSPLRLQAAICGASSGPSSGALVMGFVRSANDRTPIAEAKVAVEWVEYTLGRGGMSRHIARRVAVSHDNGWFAVCNAPKPGTLTLMASRGADSTGVVEVEVPATGFFRQELYLGPARTVAVADSTPVAEGAPAKTRRMFVGQGYLRGVVVSASSGQPLADAQVGVVNGPQTHANARGEWTMSNAPEGTRVIEVRAVGHYPVRRTVDVVDATPSTAESAAQKSPIRIEMVTFKSVLETVKVTANYEKFANLAGFRDRSKSSLGRFLSAEDIGRRQSIVTSELFRMVPGLILDGGIDPDKKIMMRGTFEERCTPAIYVNNHYMAGLSADDLDNYVRPSEIAGIEVYSESQVPPQFQPGLSGCGSIVIWTK